MMKVTTPMMRERMVPSFVSWSRSRWRGANQPRNTQVPMAVRGSRMLVENASRKSKAVKPRSVYPLSELNDSEHTELRTSSGAMAVKHARTRDMPKDC